MTGFLWVEFCCQAAGGGDCTFALVPLETGEVHVPGWSRHHWTYDRQLHCTVQIESVDAVTSVHRRLCIVRCCRCAELLLAAGANPDAGDRWCVTPLMYAVQTEWFDMAQLMISAGASVDLQDSRGRTPLILAVDCSEDVYDTIRYEMLF